MSQNTFSTTKASVVATLGKPMSRHAYGSKGKEKIEWACGCSFDETENGSGVLFACEKHAE